MWTKKAKKRNKLINLLNAAITILEYKGIEINHKDLVAVASAMENLAGIGRPRPGTKVHIRLNRSIAAYKKGIQRTGVSTDFEKDFVVQIDAKLRSKKSLSIPDKASNHGRIQAFYKSQDWSKLRYWAITKYGRTCMACGATESIIHVDHIKPLRKNWSLRLDPNNMQILCGSCNRGKGNWDETDWRPPVTKTRTFPGNER